MNLSERVNRRLRLHDLRLLLAVVEWGSMAKAAAHLHLTQSGISRAIAGLEHTLGVRLFDRTAQGVEPTLYGRALIKRASAVFDELGQGVSEIENLADPATGELRIGCTEPMTWGPVPMVIDRLIQKFPRMVFHVTQADPGTLRYRDLRERKIELAVGRIADARVDDDVEAEILYEEKVHIVAGADSPWARRRALKLADLAHAHWTLPPPEFVARRLLEEAFRAGGLAPPQISVVTFSISLHHSLLSTGQFLGALPGSLLHFSAKRMALKVLPVELPVRPGPVGIVTLRNRTLSRVAQAFVERFREVAKQLGKSDRAEAGRRT